MVRSIGDFDQINYFVLLGLWASNSQRNGFSTVHINLQMESSIILQWTKLVDFRAIVGVVLLMNSKHRKFLRKLLAKSLKFSTLQCRYCYHFYVAPKNIQERTESWTADSSGKLFYHKEFRNIGTGINIISVQAPIS